LVLLLEAGYTVRAAVRDVTKFQKVKKLKSVAPHAAQLQSVLVPDITAAGAYDEAVKGARYVVHVASPFASTYCLTSDDFEADYIQPAVKGTTGMLDSVIKASGVERVIMTASIWSIAWYDQMGDPNVINGSQVRLVPFFPTVLT
jgi:nucleoside-diphosphate-sugar epimerase